MAASDKIFAGSIPEVYDRFLVPLIFESCARDLAARLARANRATFWKRRREPAFSRDNSHRSFRRRRASSRPISISRCSISPRRN